MWTFLIILCVITPSGKWPSRGSSCSNYLSVCHCFPTCHQLSLMCVLPIAVQYFDYYVIYLSSFMKCINTVFNVLHYYFVQFRFTFFVCLPRVCVCKPNGKLILDCVAFLPKLFDHSPSPPRMWEILFENLGVNYRAKSVTSGQVSLAVNFPLTLARVQK